MAVATAPVKTTRSGRPKVPALDVARIKTEQDAQVHAATDRITDPRKRLEKLVELEDAAHAVVAELEQPMKKQALSVALHEGARGVYKGIGLSREAFSRMTAAALGDKAPNPKAGQRNQSDFIYVWDERPVAWDETVVDRARAKGVRYYRDASVTLPGIARKVVTAKAQQDVIRPLRNDLVRELFEVHGLKRNEIAEIIGRTPSRVSHITGGGERK